MTTRVLDRRPSTPDPIRTTRYNLTPVIAGLTPRSYRWTVGIVLDQQSEGACVGHAWTHEAHARPVVVDTFPRPNFQAANAQQFAFELYHWCRHNDEWDGADYEGTSVAAGAKGMVLASGLKEYRWGTNVEDLAVAVSRKGPALIGSDWYTGMFEPDADNFLNVSGDVEGGHAWLVNGFSFNPRGAGKVFRGRKAFRIHNSWGSDWGETGEAWIGYDDMATLLADQGEACIPTVRSE